MIDNTHKLTPADRLVYTALNNMSEFDLVRKPWPVADREWMDSIGIESGYTLNTSAVPEKERIR